MLSIALLFAAVPLLYGLHRLGLYLESRDLIYYWHKKPSGGSAYNPLQELVQPQIRHVIEVGEQRQEAGSDQEGDPVIPVPVVRPGSDLAEKRAGRDDYAGGSRPTVGG